MSLRNYQVANPQYSVLLFAGVGLIAFTAAGLPSWQADSARLVAFPRAVEAARDASAAPQRHAATPGPIAAAATESPPVLKDEQAIRHKLELLDRGRTFLKSVPGYTADMTKQEVVHGDPLPEQSLSLKCRHEPFSVYLVWHTWDPGREVVYVEGQNHGKLIGHDGGWKARLPALSLSPVGSLAMRDSRYPVTKAGFLALIDLMSQIHEENLKHGVGFRSKYEFPVPFDGRDCHAFTTVYDSPETSPQYRKSVTLIDEEWNIPLSTEHFEWPSDAGDLATMTADALDEATLIERYCFTNVDFNHPLTDADFDPGNSEYSFRW